MHTPLTNRDPAAAALLVVDMVNDFFTPSETGHFMPEGEHMARRLQETVERCRAGGMKIVWITTDKELYRRRPDLGALSPLMHPQKEDLQVVKKGYDAFFATGLGDSLRALGIQTAVVCGVTAEVCCFSTARTAHEEGFQVAVLSDLVGSGDYEDRGFGACSETQLHDFMMVLYDRTTATVLTAAEFSRYFAL